MGFGPIVRGDVVTPDVAAPDAGTATVVPVSNTEIEASGRNPDHDFGDPTNLSNLTGRAFVSGSYNADGSNPSDNLSMEDILNLPGISVKKTPLTVSDAGQNYSGDKLPVLNLNGSQWWVMGWTDGVL